MPLESQISKDKTPSSSKGSRSVKGGPTSSVIKTSHSEIPLSVKLESLFDLSKLRNGCDIILEPYLPSKQGDVDSVVKILPTKEGRDSSMRVWFQHWTNPNVEVGLVFLKLLLSVNKYFDIDYVFLLFALVGYSCYFISAVASCLP